MFLTDEEEKKITAIFDKDKNKLSTDCGNNNITKTMSFKTLTHICNLCPQMYTLKKCIL